MTYSKFVEKMKILVQEQVGERVRVDTARVKKNNGITVQGLSLREEGGMISPTIYLEKFYEQWEREHNFQSVVQEFLLVYESRKMKDLPDLHFFTEYENVKQLLGIKMIQREKNRLLLKELPHVDLLDLAMVCYVAVPDTHFHGNAVIMVRNEHLENWGIVPDTMFHDALSNAVTSQPAKICNLQEMISALVCRRVGEGDAEPMEPEEIWHDMAHLSDLTVGIQYQMYVLSNQARYWGASTMLYPHVLSSVAQTLKSDLYVLPSSVHELILVPSGQIDSNTELHKIVREVNSTQVGAEDVLSDNVYFYSREMGLGMLPEQVSEEKQ